MIVELLAAGISIVCMAALLLVRRRLTRQNQRIEKLTEQISRFLGNPSEALEDNLEEGWISNLENQISRLERQLLYEKRMQQQRERHTIQFVENMAHQMKTAVTALQIRLEIAQLKSVTEEERQALWKGQACVLRLNGEIDRILQSSQLAEGKIRMNFAPFSLEQTIAAICSQLKALTDKREVQIHLQCAEDLQYYGDLFWLIQALENVVKNAAEHTRKNGCVWISVKDCGNCVQIVIEDEGKGIPAEEFPLLFQRFARGRGTKSGYGIGLSMARDIIRAHHGSLTAENRKKNGARFVISLPVLEGAKAYAAETRET